MITKAPPEVLSPSDLAYMSTLNERDRRWFLATKAANLKTQGLSYRKVSKIMGTSTHTLQNRVGGNEVVFFLLDDLFVRNSFRVFLPAFE